jgi:hypothetical protein
MIPTSRCSSDRQRTPSHSKVGVVDDADGVAIIPRDARPFEVPEGLVDTMTTTRAQRANAIERWAENLDADDLVQAKTAALRTIADLSSSETTSTRHAFWRSHGFADCEPYRDYGFEMVFLDRALAAVGC